MHSFLCLLRRALRPVTIMLIPHSARRSITLRVPGIVLLAAFVSTLWGAGYMYKAVQDAARYVLAKQELDYYQNSIQDLKSTLSSLQMANVEFKKLFSLDTKEEVLDNMNFSDSGALDMEVLRRQINKTIDNVAEIRDYLSLQRDLYRATPLGWPIKGWLSSPFGRRFHPIRGDRDFHTGVDISTTPGDPVRVTADGIVSFSGRSGANGNLVAVEHGFGYSTYYAHNKKNLVEVGQVVKRGDVISHVGSTGSSTGPHVHYEIWKNGKNVNPMKYMKGESW